MPRKLPWLVDDDVKEAKKSKLKSEPKANVELPSRDAQQEDDQNEDSARDYKARGVDFLRSCEFNLRRTRSRRLFEVMSRTNDLQPEALLHLPYKLQLKRSQSFLLITSKRRSNVAQG